MKSILKVKCILRGLSAEKLLNAARKEGIPLFRAERRQDRSVFIQCSRDEYTRLLSLAQEKGYTLSAPEPAGLYGMISRLLNRWGLLLGACSFLALIIYAMGFIWHISIENAGAYEGEIRLFLQEQGIHAGMRREKVDAAQIQEQLEWRLPEVKWVRTGFSGVVLKIALEPGTPPPDIASHEGSGDILAGEDGLLLRLTAYAGTPAVKNGDFVRKGQVLIKGEERGKDGKMIPVQAQGAAVARIWVTAQAQVSLREWISHPTGRETQRKVILTPFFSIPLEETPDFLTWDVERHDQQAGNIWLPVTVRREKYLEISLEEGQRNLEEARQEAGKAALRLLNQALIDENIIDKWLEFRMIEGDTIAAAATAEIHRDIACCQIN